MSSATKWRPFCLGLNVLTLEVLRDIVRDLINHLPDTIQHRGVQNMLTPIYVWDQRLKYWTIFHQRRINTIVTCCLRQQNEALGYHARMLLSNV